MELPVNKREHFSQLPTHEPKPNAFSAETFEVEEIELHETIREVNVSYTSLIALSAFLMILGGAISTMTVFAIYGPAIERGNLMYETDNLIKRVQYNTEQIRDKVNANASIILRINENIEKLGSGIVEELKPKEAKIVNQ